MPFSERENNLLLLPFRSLIIKETWAAHNVSIEQISVGETGQDKKICSVSHQQRIDRIETLSIRKLALKMIECTDRWVQCALEERKQVTNSRISIRHRSSSGTILLGHQTAMITKQKRTKEVQSSLVRKELYRSDRKTLFEALSMLFLSIGSQICI